MKSTLPDHLRLRTRTLHDALVPTDARFVLYWMRTAQRGHDNPALDVAIALGNDLGLPVLVYQEFNAHGPGPFPTARHITFQLEAALDIATDLNGRQITYQAYAQTHDATPSLLPELTAHAACLITEDLPTHWYRHQTQQDLSQLTSPPLTLAVNTSCIVPPALINGKHDRAYLFRNAHKPLLSQHLVSKWPPQTPTVPSLDLATLPDTIKTLPFLDLPTLASHPQRLSDLVASMDLDHSVAPVYDTPGGSRAAYQRWRHFRDHHLASYHTHRNDAALPTHVSRLSAYLHFGQISPFRIAAQATALSHPDNPAQIAPDGPVKFLDEFLTWREFAHHIGTWQTDPPGISWLPDWARDTLQKHQSDPRPAIYDRETLSRARSSDPLWNLAQQSLLAHGELHNNLRMTWGKKLLEWHSDPTQSIALAIELNDRFALDGGDPNSYVGLLWCFGAFDRPFSPEIPIFGTVRPRSTDHHARRLNTDRYQQWVHRAPAPDTRIALIGAGLSACAAARTLLDHNLTPLLFDKARGPGGRASTRHTDHADHTLHFDHGAQYFTARSPSLQHYLSAWQSQGIVSPYRPRLAIFDPEGFSIKDETTPRFVATPGMNALTRHLLKDLPDTQQHFQHRLTHIEALHDGPHPLRLTFSSSKNTQNQSDEPNETITQDVDHLLLSAPAPQAAELLQPIDPDLAHELQTISFDPTWAVMLAIDHPDFVLPFDAAFVNHGPLSWIANNSAKPLRQNDSQTTPQQWLLHASPEWSAQHLEATADSIASLLLQAFFDLLAQLPHPPSSPTPSFLKAHRWRFARAHAPRASKILRSQHLPITLLGDYLFHSRIEGAFLSGQAAASHLIHQLAIQHRNSPSSLIDDSLATSHRQTRLDF